MCFKIVFLVQNLAFLDEHLPTRRFLDDFPTTLSDARYIRAGLFVCTSSGVHWARCMRRCVSPYTAVMAVQLTRVTQSPQLPRSRLPQSLRQSTASLTRRRRRRLSTRRHRPIAALTTHQTHTAAEISPIHLCSRTSRCRSKKICSIVLHLTL